MVCYCLRGNWNKKSGIPQNHCAAMINEKVHLELKSRSVCGHTQDILLSCHAVGHCSHTRKLSYRQIHPLGCSSYMTSRTETNKATSELGAERWQRLSTWGPFMICQEQWHSWPVKEGTASGGMQPCKRPLPPPPTSPSVLSFIQIYIGSKLILQPGMLLTQSNYERKAHLERRQKSAPFSVSQLSPPPHHVFLKPGAVPSTKCTGKHILGPAVIWSWHIGCGWIRNQLIGPGTMWSLVRLWEQPSPSASPTPSPASLQQSGMPGQPL